jgi:nucleotide-binding universal stress UspA family protein
MGVGTLTVSSYMNEIKKQTEQWASQVRAMADAKGGVKTTADTIFNITSVAESIISYADEQRADLIVMGTRGRAGLKRLVLGSVASGVVEHATCPVLVVR